jgi:glycosyltransferase involved in cell wall biosynthesis
MLKIDILASDGSPMGLVPPDIYGKGVGGAELALMSWAETMAQRGHAIRIYNNPIRGGIFDGVQYRPNSDFNPNESRDVFILWRSPNPQLRIIKAGYKIHWSTDQQTRGNFATDIFPWVDKIVCISPFHVEYHKNRYEVENGRIGYIDLGVRLADYEKDVERVPGRCIFCSIPDRGLDILYHLWPKIKERVPEASLVITSDYRLWGAASSLIHKHRSKWLHQADVQYVGKIERGKLVEEQLKAVCQPYPCLYEELFCISTAECQVSGAMPVTSQTGALKSTNEFGFQFEGNPAAADWQKRFVDKVAWVLNNGTNKTMQRYARRRFDWDLICRQWENLIATGEFE